MLALPVLRDRTRRQVRTFRQEFWHDAADLTQPKVTQAGARGFDSWRPQPGCHRCVRRPPAAIARRHRREVTAAAPPLDELFCQACLAHAGLAKDQEQVSTRPAGLKMLAQGRPLMLAANQWPARSLVPARRLSWHLALRDFVCLARGTGWLFVQFSSEYIDASLVDAQRACVIASQHVEAHQPAIGGLVQRILLKQPLAIRDRSSVVPLSLQDVHELVQCALSENSHTIALADDPLVIETG